jgi:hypothetical protein
MTKINAALLPAPSEIDHVEIREAAEQFSAAQQAFRDHQRALAKLDQPARELAKDADAKEAEAALAFGKPVPKRRHIAAFNQRFDDAEHTVRIAQLALKRALENFQSIVDTHGEGWARSLEKAVTAADGAWTTAVDALELAHRDRLTAYRKAAVTGMETPPISAVRLKPADLHGVDLAYLPDPRARVNARAIVTIDAITDALRSLGEIEEPTPVAANLDAEQVKRAFQHAREVGKAREEDRVKNLNPAQPLSPERAA